MDHTFCCITANHSRHTGICNGLSFIDYSAKFMTTHGFNDSIAILTCCKARSKCDCDRGHIACGSKILFCKNRIYHYHRFETFQTISFRVNEHRQLIFFQKTLRLVFILRQKTLHVLYFGTTFIHCLTECHISADCRWMCDFQYQYRKTTFFQFINRSGCNISATTNDNQIFHINLAFLPSDFHPFYLITKSADMKQRDIF